MSLVDNQPDSSKTEAGRVKMPKAQKRGSLGLIFFVMLMDVVGITILQPVAPQIVMRYSSSALMVTMIPVFYAMGQFCSTPVFGKLGDRYGRRPILLFSLVGQSLGYLIFGLGGSLGMLLLGRLVGGITGGNLSTASAYIADVSRPEERSKNFAVIGTAWSLGLILGPAIGGLFGQLSLETPAFVAAGISAINVLLGFFLLPESLPKERRTAASLSLRDFNPITSILGMARKPGMTVLLLVYSLFSFAFNGISSTSAIFVIEKFAAVTWQISLMMILSGLSIALTNSIVVPRWIPRFGEKKSVIVSLLAVAIFSVVVFLVPSLWLVFPFSMLSSAANSFIFPSLTTLTAELVSPREMGELMGVTSAVGSLMNIFGPLWGGLVYDHVMTGAPYWMGAFIFVFAAYMITRMSARLPQRDWE